MSTITPTIGRKVWYFAGGDGQVLDTKQAFDADIVFVHDATTVNLAFHDHTGNRHSAEGIELRDPGADDSHDAGHYATWMPYQVGQAKPAA